MPLPFQPNHAILEDNCRVNRLGNLLRKLKKQPELMEHYDNIIKEEKRADIIVEVSNDNDAVEEHPCLLTDLSLPKYSTTGLS